MANRYHSSEVRRRRNDATQAVSKGELDTLAKLVTRGVDINGRDAEGRTLLLHAREAPVARWLIERGADVNVFSNEGYTPLMEAARYGRADIAQVLIDARADLHLRSTQSHLTALQLAEQIGHVEVARLLRTAGAKD
jgi:ankyrin repeat protein